MDDAFIIGTQGKIKSAFGTCCLPSQMQGLLLLIQVLLFKTNLFLIIGGKYRKWINSISKSYSFCESKLTDAGNDKGIGRKIGSEDLIIGDESQ